MTIEQRFSIMLITFSILAASAAYVARTLDEMKANRVERWSTLCEALSDDDEKYRRGLDMKFGDREKAWCRNTFYELFK